MKVLAIDGPADGKFLDIDEKIDSFKYIKQDRPSVSAYPLPTKAALVGDYQYVIYKKCELVSNVYTKRVIHSVLVSVPSTDIIKKLIEGYRAA